jgi:hypothetical protein
MLRRTGHRHGSYHLCVGLPWTPPREGGATPRGKSQNLEAGSSLGSGLLYLAVSLSLASFLLRLGLLIL